MEWHHRSIPEILKQQEKQLSDFQEEKSAAFIEFERSVSDLTGSKRLSLQNDWNLKELVLVRNLREILQHRLNAIDKELFPEPDEKAKPHEPESKESLLAGLDKKHRLELDALAGDWRREIHETQPPKHDRVNREFEHEEELLLDRQKAERDQLEMEPRPLSEQNKADKRASVLAIMNQDNQRDKANNR